MSIRMAGAWQGESTIALASRTDKLLFGLPGNPTPGKLLELGLAWTFENGASQFGSNDLK